MCKQSYYGRTKCGDSISRFHPVGKSLRSNCISTVSVKMGGSSMCKSPVNYNNINNIIVWCFPIETVKVAGYFAIAGTLSLAVFCILSIVQLAMVVSKEKVVFAYSKTVVTKLVFAFAASKYIIIHTRLRYILKIIYTIVL